MTLRRFQPLVLGLALVVGAFIFAQSKSSAQQAQPSGFRTVSGASAAAFSVPIDMEQVLKVDLDAYGLIYERYQQFFGPAHAEVLGAQVTIYRDGSGAAVTVIGTHYPGIVPANRVQLARANAAAVADRDIGPDGERLVDLVIDPANGRYAYRVETRRLDSRWFHVIDAGNGQVLQKFDALAFDHGTGVKGDAKDIDGPDGITGSTDDLSTLVSGAWRMTSKDNRQITYDAHNGNVFLYNATDTDNHWTTAGTAYPGQPAVVDAQYYARSTDQYYQQQHGLDWLTCYPAGMKSVAHYSSNYNNAFWNGTYVVYGDGDGVTFRNFSGGQDVVSHELTHAVTDCFSKLVYSGESGALNEAFSDMMGNSAEFFVGEPNTSNCVRAGGQTACPDWWIGEDVYLSASTVPGFRNMADPAEDGDPDHYSERYLGSNDNGGVHTNSAIPNHAYYLVIHGGQTAGCGRGHVHCTGDGATNVGGGAGLGVLKAERIFYTAFTALPSNATMCNARAATETQALGLYGTAERDLVTQAWKAVGLIDGVCGLGPTPTPTPTSTPTAANTPTSTPTAANTPTSTPTAASSPTSTPTSTQMHLGGLAGSSSPNGSSGWRATVIVTAHDGTHAPLSGVTISGAWSTGGSGSCTTASNGTCTITSRRLSTSSLSTTFQVTSLSRSGFSYQPAANDVATSKTINKP